MSHLQRFRGLPGARAALQIALGLAIVAALAVLALRPGEQRGIEIELRDPAPGIDQIRVDVSGAVLEPQVVTAAPGDRVSDVIALAGGLAADADTAPLNLSRRVFDEDAVHVPRIGEAVALLDVNSATLEQLDALPGIGPAYAAAIVAERERAGPYATTDDLTARGTIPEHVYEGIREMIAAR